MVRATGESVKRRAGSNVTTSPFGARRHAKPPRNGFKRPLAEYFWLAEHLTGLDATVLVKVARVDLADFALHAPQAGFGHQDFSPTCSTKRRC